MLAGGADCVAERDGEVDEEKKTANRWHGLQGVVLKICAALAARCSGSLQSMQSMSPDIDMLYACAMACRMPFLLRGLL